MARVTHVKKAQQRYATVPVIDPATGEPKRTPVMKKVRVHSDATESPQVTEVQKTTKRGKPVFMTVTVQDKTKPLDPYTCDSCGEPIKVGTPYKHVTPKSGPYGGRKRTRHEACPTWQIWELSNSWSARVAQATHGFDVTDLDAPGDVEAALSDVANDIRELAEESRETASNIEDGFGHPTQQSEDAEARADELDGWADEIEQADIPELPDPEETECETCGGTGQADTDEEDAEELPCEECDGTGQVTPDEPTDEQMDEWREQVQDAVSIVDESPV